MAEYSGSQDVRADAPHTGQTIAVLWSDTIRSRSILKILPLMALIVFGGLFARHISALDGAEVWAALTGLALWQWLAALVLTALSFAALGTYDVLVHKVLRTGQAPRAARAAGIKAIALSQTLGFGTITSALVRWRCLPDFSVGASLRLSAVVSASFLVALAVVTAAVVPFSGLVQSFGGMVATGVFSVAALLLLARLAFRLGWIPAPVSLSTLLALLLATAVDTAFAAGALWVLWPEAVSFDLLFAAYLIALGAGLISSAPGGVGAFDLAFLALLPVSDDASALAALLAFRIIYYAIPAGLALVSLLRPVRHPDLRPLDHPEACLARQSAVVSRIGGTSVLTLPCWGGGAVLGDLPAHMNLNKLRGWSSPRALYKCSAAQAVLARSAGWQVMRCAQDAILDVQTWTTKGAARRQLRRALAGFAKSGLSIRETRNMAALSDVARVWAEAHGGEKGHTMGQFCPDYLRHQRVFAAFDGATPVAFVSFHTGSTWTLDLMRHLRDLPNGTMHALVEAAIRAAKDASATTLSLASVPAPEPHIPFAAKALTETAGLRRFKESFGPAWRPRYFCARSRAGLVGTAALLAWRIHNPTPVAPISAAQPDHEHFSFAPLLAPCDSLATQSGALRHDQRPDRPFSNA